MKNYFLVLSPEAEEDIDEGFKWYNAKSPGLGFEFVNTIDIYFRKITAVPTASAVRYDNIRVKPVDTFPYTIHYWYSEEDMRVIILRVFNTSQEPFWDKK